MRFKQKPQLDSASRQKIVRDLENVTEADLPRVKPLLYDYLQSAEVPVVVETLELIARFELLEFQPELERCLGHDTALVQTTALKLLFDLQGSKSLAIYERYYENEHLGLSMTALCMAFVASQNSDLLPQIRELIDQDYDYHYLSSLMMRLFEEYLELGGFPQVRELLVYARDRADETSEFYEEVGELL